MRDLVGDVMGSSHRICELLTNKNHILFFSLVLSAPDKKLFHINFLKQSIILLSNLVSLTHFYYTFLLFVSKK